MSKEELVQELAQALETIDEIGHWMEHATQASVRSNRPEVQRFWYERILLWAEVSSAAGMTDWQQEIDDMNAEDASEGPETAL